MIHPVRLVRFVVPALAAAIAIGPGVAAPPPKAAKATIPLPLKQIIPAPQRLCNAKTASGLGTMVLRPGGAGNPGPSANVTVNYIGYLAATGEVFDQGTGVAFPVSGVIKGFSEGLRGMRKGEIARLCIPATLGYGARETGPIPANSDLVFQVELIDF